MLLFLLVALLLFSNVTAQDAVISEREGACVPLGGNDNVTFTCSGGSDLILWRVASRQIREAEFQGIFINTTNDSSGVYTSTIVFTARALEFLSESVEEMEVEVTCQVEQSLFDTVDADTTSIVIYSPPPPPENLLLIPTATPLKYQLQWTRPSSQPDCVPINYLLTVINIENETTILENEVVSASEMVMYDDSESGQCQLHEFQVSSFNDANEVGESSDPATIRATLPISPNVSGISSSLMARPLFSDDEIMIEVTFQPATTCDEVNHPILYYLVEAVSEMSGVSANTTDLPPAVILTSPTLEEGTYTVVVSACADFGCRIAEPVPVVVSMIQNASITFLNTTVLLECWFIATASSDGCIFSLDLPDGQTEVIEVERPNNGSLRAQLCATTQNRREAYLSFKVKAEGSDGEFDLEPVVTVTADLEDIAPCELPPPDVIVDVVEESELSTGEVVAIIIGVLVFFFLLMILAIILVWWKRQDIHSAYKHWVHHLTEEQGIDLMMEEREEKPTIMMLMKNLIPDKRATTAATVPKKKGLSREASQQADFAAAITKEEEAEMGPKYSDGAQPSSPPPLSGKEPVAAIKLKDPEEPNSLHLLLKPATLARVVQIWKSKVNRGEEMLLYWKEDEEDVDDDEPYYEDQEDSMM